MTNKYYQKTKKSFKKKHLKGTKKEDRRKRKRQKASICS